VLRGVLDVGDELLVAAGGEGFDGAEELYELVFGFHELYLHRVFDAVFAHSGTTTVFAWPIKQLIVHEGVGWELAFVCLFAMVVEGGV
jgi:hypothetical protein